MESKPKDEKETSNQAQFAAFKQMLVENSPCKFVIDKEGAEVALHMNHGSDKPLIINKDGTWRY